MSIAGILNHKGSLVLSVAPDDDAAHIAGLLTDRGIGAVLVIDQSAGRPGLLLGIVSERDIVRRLSRDGAAALGLSARALMTAVQWTLSPEADIADAMRIMTEHRVRHLPVLDQGDLVGLVSIGDVVKARLDQQASELDQLRAYVSGAT